MKVTVTTTPSEYGGDHSIDIRVDTEEGTQQVSFWAGEPEDFSLTRDLNGAYSIKDLVKLAYEAGKNGEPYVLLNQKVEE
jgi:hypothetical protein